MKLFRKRMRSQAATGVHITRGVAAVATIDHERGRRPRLIQADNHDLTGSVSLERVLRDSVPSGRTPVTLVMASEHYELLLVEAPRVEPSELRAAVRWKVKNLIDFHIDDAVIDVFEIPGQQNRPQGQSMMYAITARAREIRERVDLFEDADLNLQVIDVADMALRNLAAQLEDDVRGVAMLYLDDERGLITLSRQGSLYLSRRLETGSLQLAEKGAEARDQIMLEIQRSLDYYDSHFSQPPVTSVHVLPGFDGHDELVSALSEGLDIETRSYDASAVLRCDTPLPSDHTSALLLAIGGALRREEISL